MMTPEEKALLERTYAIAEENNELLRKIRRSSQISAIVRITYWVIIIFLSFGAYYFIQPYFTTLLGVTDQAGGVSGIQNNINQAQNTVDSLRELLK